MFKAISTIDTQTGEVTNEGVLVYLPNKTQHPYREHWIAVYQQALKIIARDKEIGEEALRVFLILTGYLDYENYIHIPQTQLASMISMARSNFNRSLKKLINKDILIRGPKIGKSYTFRLNPNIAWKGKKELLRQELRLVKNGRKEIY